MVPVLTLVFGVPMKSAIATSLICVIATSSMAQTVYVGKGLTHVRLGMLLEVGTTMGALIGVLVALALDDRVLKVTFAALLAFVVWRMGARGDEAAPAGRGALPTSFIDPATGREVRYGVQRLGLGLLLSFGVGGVSGSLGVGGGAFNVPLLNLLMRVPLKATVATSNLMIGVTAAVSAAIFYRYGYIDLLWTVPAVFGIVGGASLGPRLSLRLSERALTAALRVVLGVFALAMVAQVIVGTS